MTRKGLGKNHNKKEKIAILAASGFVLAALTMTGLYMREQNELELDDGYTIDFDALEESVESKNQEIARNIEKKELESPIIPEEAPKVAEAPKENNKKPVEKEVPKEIEQVSPSAEPVEETQTPQVVPEQAEVPEAEALEADTTQVLNSPLQAFDETKGLVRPLNGEVILPFSMDSSIYFKTLDQYKYNPAMIVSSEAGTSVLACADGQVSNIYDSRETGKTLVVDMGGGYTMTYGQLQDVCVTVGSYVTAGSMIARVAEPTIYYTLEGTNLYLLLEKDGEPMNPQPLFQ
ncbi:MAG: peptidoglycan DD-metalloendopeptidase family protein [Lachnospiraceae bacterium]|nr:peptidoglycan DD-metalloendopeptidase family protein [Lachnospiraceae bacterium]